MQLPPTRETDSGYSIVTTQLSQFLQLLESFDRCSFPCLCFSDSDGDARPWWGRDGLAISSGFTARSLGRALSHLLYHLLLLLLLLLLQQLLLPPSPYNHAHPLFGNLGSHMRAALLCFSFWLQHISSSISNSVTCKALRIVPYTWEIMRSLEGSSGFGPRRPLGIFVCWYWWQILWKRCFISMGAFSRNS